jgi:hypothetical protein
MRPASARSGSGKFFLNGAPTSSSRVQPSDLDLSVVIITSMLDSMRLLSAILTDIWLMKKPRPVTY